jgi:serine/threonine protein kinase/Tfp pilus assembly protein PilF
LLSSILSGLRPGCSPSWPASRDDPGTPAGSSLEPILREFTERWERGETPSAEEYLPRLSPDRASDAVELIYHAYCLAESAGLDPDPGEYLRRFPAQGESLERIFGLHETLDSVSLRLWTGHVDWPEVGDEIGPYRLLRELGRGGFARVFLAEQADLDHRLVVAKVSTRVTPEPRLLARARHSHIVEVLWHGSVDDGTFQLVVMPFLGGATLSAVLAERRRRGGRPTSGRDLLADLDRVSATEYPTATLARPAREILGGLSYFQALAWIVARLAEALDHAYGRGVAHGDIKPSNVLLTADGTPMLLDFNLAVGWQSPRSEDLPDDPGGTLPYMPPERLCAFADPSPTSLPRTLDRHRADLYSLGVVLLESLTGRPQAQPRGEACSARALAAALAASRRGDVGRMIRASGVPIPPALRAILARCLAPDPADRYRRAGELAEDLDRWRTDRALAFATESTWPSRLRRWARRNRSTLATATLCSIVGIAATLAVRSTFRSSLRDQATDKLNRIWDHADAGTFRFRHTGYSRPEEQGDPAENALRHLDLYDVLGPDDWRRRDDVRQLSEDDRAELECWLMEQTLRFARALGERRESVEDWRRALAALDRVLATRSLGPLETQRRILRDQLIQNEDQPPAPDHPTGDAPPRWMEEYMLGVEAEPSRPGEALAHYRNVLEVRPNSFWAHYRVAAIAFLRSDNPTAITHLRACLARRPNNPVLHGLLAGRLYAANRLDEALEECNKSLAIDPDRPEFYLSRAFIRYDLGQEESYDADLGRFDLLKGRRGLASFSHPGAPFSREIERVLGHHDVMRRDLATNPGDVDVRLLLAAQLQHLGDHEAALEEFDTVLEINPDHLLARFNRGMLLRKLQRDEAERDFAFLVEHPRLDDLLRYNHYAIRIFQHNSLDHLRHGRLQEAERAARLGLEHANRRKMLQDEAHYALARVYAVGARTRIDWAPLAIRHLRAAFRNKSIQHWFDHDPLLADQRATLTAALHRSPGEVR